MSSLSYWEKRKAKDMFRYMESAEQAADEIAQLYLKSSRYLSHELDTIFERFKSKHRLTDAEAYRLLGTLQDKSSLAGLKEALRSGSADKSKAELLAELESPAYQARMERIQQLQNQIDLTMQQVYGQEKIKNTSHYVSLANEAYYRSMFNIQQQTGLAFAFSAIDPNMINQVINSSWSGEHYSKRIWRNTDALARDLKEELLIHLLTGRTDREVAEIIANKFAQSASNARRLVRTESCNLANQLDMLSYRECGIETYIYLATLDLRTSSTCRELDGKRFQVSEQQPGLNCPPMHPWCRSTTICDISDEELAAMQRRARDPVTGKTKLVPANMTYQEWYEKSVKGNSDAVKKETMWNNRFADKKQHEKYRQAFGTDIPESFDKFQDLKYNRVEEFEILQEKALTKKKESAFLKELQSGSINTSVRTVKQQEHILGTKKWKQRVKNDLVSKNSAPDMFFKEIDIQELVNQGAGTGVLKFRKGQTYPLEYVTSPNIVGKAFNPKTQKYENTSRFAIRYSSKGVHAHPVYERKWN